MIIWLARATSFAKIACYVKAFEEIAREANKLSRKQKLDLVSLLLETTDDSAEAEVSVAWEQEILARIQAVDEGQAEGLSFEQVMRDAEGRLTS